MAWKPDNKIGGGEHIGRRLFNESKLSGAPDQNPWKGLAIGNFIEKRGTFSVDRLGRTGIEKPVVEYLKLRCLAHEASRKDSRFDGWAYLKPSKIVEAVSSPPVASEIRTQDNAGVDEDWDDANPKQNLYHAHVVIPEGTDPLLFAFRFREKVGTEKGVYPAPWIKLQGAVDSEQRRKMIETAAYYLAEKRGFEPGHETEDWAAAEKEIDATLKG